MKDWLLQLVGSTVFQTVISGVLVFSIGEILARFLLEPLKGFKETVGRIDNRLKFYANAYWRIADPLTLGGNHPEYGRDLLLRMQEIIDSLRQCSCDFESCYKQIPCRRLFALMGVIPDDSGAALVAMALIRLSNQAVTRNPDANIIAQDQETVRNILGIQPLGR